MLDSVSLERQNVETTHKWSPVEAAMWIQLIAFRRLDGQYLLDAAADAVQGQLGAATIAKRSFSKESRLVRSELQSDDDEASQLFTRASKCRMADWDRYAFSVELETEYCRVRLVCAMLYNFYVISTSQGVLV